MQSPQQKISNKSNNKISRFYGSLYLNTRLFYLLSVNVLLFIISFIFPIFFVFSKLALILTILVMLIDIGILYQISNGIKAKRILPEKFSNSDENTVKIHVRNLYSLTLNLLILDEVPFQFQIRDFNINKKIKALKATSLVYNLTPVERGEYHFGNLLIFAQTSIGLISRKYSFQSNQMVKTYPSFLQLKKFELIGSPQQTNIHGLKKNRRIGQSFEFEQIKDYVQGDIIKNINWKATAKKNELMVNQFQDEKSQQIYTIIDKGRVMKMPFNNLSLLDYAINASLVICSTVLRKHDKAGIFSFSKTTDNFVAAEKRNSQMRLILESLYNIKTNFQESDYSGLYTSIKKNIRQRSLLFLFTNFESLDAVHRQLNYLRAINKSHLLVVVFFENTHLQEMAHAKADTIQEIFDKTIAEKFSQDKRLIISELKKFGIQTIYSSPEKLTINSLNKYLEIKAKGLL